MGPQSTDVGRINEAAALTGFSNEKIERLSITFTSNGKREFAPCDKVSPLLVVHRLLFSSTHNLVVLRNFLFIRIVLSNFLRWEILNLNLPFAVNVVLNISNVWAFLRDKKKKGYNNEVTAGFHCMSFPHVIRVKLHQLCLLLDRQPYWLILWWHNDVALEAACGSVLVKQYSVRSVIVRQCWRNKGSTTSPSRPASNIPMPVATATKPKTNSLKGNSYESVNTCRTLAYMIPIISPAKKDVRSKTVMCGRKRYQAAKRQKTRIPTSTMVSNHNFLTVSLETSSFFIMDTTARYDLPRNSPIRNKVM